MRRLWKWLKDNAEPVGAGAAIVGVVVGVVGFWATWHQLTNATVALQAANGYAIQKDARELVDGMSTDENFVAALNNGPAPEKADAFDRKLWKMFNFYLSVYRQGVAEGLSSKFVAAFSDDFCRFIRRPVVSREWDKMQQNQMLGINHVEMRENWCSTKP